MKAWQIAAAEQSRTLSRHTGDSSQPDDDPQWLIALRYKYKIWNALKNRNYKCFFCQKQSKNTTGHLPGIGPIMKCITCQEEYNETVQALNGETK